LYASTAAQSRDFTFLGLISHRAELKATDRTANDDTSGSDAALAALKNNLASYEQVKQANQTNITNTVLPAPKSRFEAAKNQKSGRKNNLLGSQAATPSLSAIGTPRSSQGPTSVPASEDDVKMQAMRTPVIHLLAMGATTSESILTKTHIPKVDLDQILQKSGKKVDGKWELADRAFRDLDVWAFDYPSQKERQSAIDGAIRAYDRLRLGKDEKLWQMLLPKEERGKGTILSKLQLGGSHVNRGLTPSYQPSPMPHLDAAGDSRVASAANTPRLGATTPRPSSSKGDVMKRLLSKDPKRAQVAEQTKEKKRKDREAAASDREGGRPVKKQATQSTGSNTKSAEFVHSSDEDSGEDAVTRNQSKPTKEIPKVKPETRPAAAEASSPDSSDPVVKSKVARKPVAHGNSSSATSKKIDSPALKANKPVPAGRATPQTNGNLSAPNTQHKSQRSPQKQDSRPNVPSPLGAARPRVASDVSDRAAVGVQRVKSGGSDTPKGLGISRETNNHQTKTAVNGSEDSDMAKKRQPVAKQQKASTNGTTPKPSLTNGAAHKPDTSVKRKADEPLLQGQNGTSGIKHHKTNSSSSQSQKSRSDSSTANNETPRTSPNGLLDGDGSDSTVSVVDTITYSQGVSLAESFQKHWYPAYEKLYNELESKEGRGETIDKEERDRLWGMHRRLEQRKREIQAASRREHGDE